jgi:hypothetical protein
MVRNAMESVLNDDAAWDRLVGVAVTEPLLPDSMDMLSFEEFATDNDQENGWVGRIHFKPSWRIRAADYVESVVSPWPPQSSHGRFSCRCGQVHPHPWFVSLSTMECLK